MESDQEYELHIPACLDSPPHPLHPPLYEKPLRIYVYGPLSAIEKLLPNVPWTIDYYNQRDLQPSAIELARIIYRVFYGLEPQLENDIVLRDEQLGWFNPNMPPE